MKHLTIRLVHYVLVISVLLYGCGGGGGSSDSTSPPSNPAPTQPPPESASGIWQGTVKGQQSGMINKVSCLVTQAEELACLLVDPGTDQLAGAIYGNVSVANTNEITGSGNIYAATGFVLSDGSTFSDFTITSGTVDERSTLDLIGSDGTETWDAITDYSDRYERGASLSAAAGVYTGFTVDGVEASFSINDNGEIFAQSQTGCVGNGQISVLNSEFNEYRVTMTVSNCTEANGDYEGLAITDDFQATNDVLLFGIFTGQQAIFGAVAE